jgi:hypothetical protein
MSQSSSIEAADIRDVELLSDLAFGLRSSPSAALAVPPACGRF